MVTPLLMSCVLVLAVGLCARHLLRVRRNRRAIRERHRKASAGIVGSSRQRRDGLVQSLLGVTMQIHAAAARLPRDGDVRGALESALEDADQVLAVERDGVPPSGEWPSEDDLCAALCDAARCLRGEGAAQVEIVAVGRRRAVNAKALFTAYRIAREAILNALRHAQASQVSVAVVYGRTELSVRVRDNGTGFFLARGGAPRRHGLARMHALAQRLAGSLSVLSVLGGGTAVEFRLRAGRAYEA